MVTRTIFVLLSGVAGLALFTRGGEYQPASLLGGFAIGAVTGLIILLSEYVLQKLSFGIILGGTAGLGVGLLLTGLTEWVGSAVFDVQTVLFHVGGLVFLLGFPYLGMVLGAQFGKERFVIRPDGPVSHTNGSKILDTSVIIDGRVSDLCETGFLEGPFIVPHFILQELQHIADSSDTLKRARGRRGLDILNKIQKMPDLEVRIVEDDFPHIREVDAKIVALAKKVRAKVVTNDLNLNKVAELQGVRVLNINELCNALRPVVLPGEAMRVFVLKEGKEPGQGVAYLDDGTMIVVDNARRWIGRNVDVVVTSVLQTTAGRMIFTRLKDENEREELQVARG
ncbi:putative PIN and TRAM-domain containing protein YacL [Nitrospira tepida]|uniref:PIN and TRAM-domain containing protein YacL n=1 Tax=Nitrospira tepida TaxID=2973512 RepID=A0AA86N0W0_9BACT|nr:PIN domain-containing protein [Nitrospira tepida]CAI4032647.1 putative PIN and TRAM-domain containing protein YacL [Nitrospira tepida]